MLIDAHIHMGLSPYFSKKIWQTTGLKQRQKWIRDTLLQYKSRNIYILRDGGDGIFASETARQIAASEGMIYKSPIYALYKKGHYGSFLGKPIDSTKDFKEKFKVLMSHKPDHLKIILTGIINFSCYGDFGGIGFTQDELNYMVSAAKENNMPVMVHANGSKAVNMAITSGVSTIEHGYLISKTQLYDMEDKGIVWVPTLAPLGNIISSSDPKFKEEMEVIKKVFKSQVENVENGVEMGVKIALGSDSGAYRVAHSSGLYDEIAFFERTGLSKMQIEKMCFENGMSALKLKATDLPYGI